MVLILFFKKYLYNLFVTNYKVAMKFSPEKLKALRHERKYSLNKLVIAMDNVCTAAAINSWERGVCLPSVAYLPVLAKVLGVDMTYFFE